ncbi:hypothetical protein DH86_00001789 [Scytalidium sp. 3C]|nr:hypothetical protein DH86_00001789 [Scytalidium sp. 3C]
MTEVPVERKPRREGSVEKPAEEEEDDVAAMLKGMKKKKSKKPKAEDGEEAGDAAPADGELDLSMMKKKKKSKKPKEGAEDDFEAKLAALDLEGKGPEGEAATEQKPVEEGDMDQGTGIWAHDATTSIPYELLLSRFFKLLEQKNPDHASSGSKSYKIPPPQCLREGNKKTIFANIAEICKRMNRSEDHVTSYLFAELGTSGSVDGSRRLVMQLLWISTKCTADQDWFLCPGRQEKETARLSGWVSHGIMALRMFLLGL